MNLLPSMVRMWIKQNPRITAQFLLIEDNVYVEFFTADIEERTSLKQSSMPEGLAAAMAPVEFLDLVAYLATLK